jgi:acyl carrier protein
LNEEEIELAIVEEKITELIAEQLQVAVAEVIPEADFEDHLGADSLDILVLVMQFEQEFDIEIPDEDAKKIKTVADATKYIASHMKGR